MGVTRDIKLNFFIDEVKLKYTVYENEMNTEQYSAMLGRKGDWLNPESGEVIQVFDFDKYYLQWEDVEIYKLYRNKIQFKIKPTQELSIFIAVTFEEIERMKLKVEFKKIDVLCTSNITFFKLIPEKFDIITSSNYLVLDSFSKRGVLYFSFDDVLRWDFNMWEIFYDLSI